MKYLEFLIILIKLSTCLADVNDVYNVRNLHKKHTNGMHYARSIKHMSPFSAPSFASDTESCKLSIQCDDDPRNSQLIKLPIYGPPGAQGPPGMPGHRGLRGEPGVNGIPARELPPPNFSAFFAALMNNTGPDSVDRDLVFSKVITNYGNNYDANTGYYTAPYNGIYQFMITVSATGQQQAGVNIMKNRASILTVWSDSQPWSTSSQNVILRLKRGDIVYLRVQSRASHLHGYLYSSFGGNLMYEEMGYNLNN